MRFTKCIQRSGEMREFMENVNNELGQNENHVSITIVAAAGKKSHTNAHTAG